MRTLLFLLLVLLCPSASWGDVPTAEPQESHEFGLQYFVAYWVGAQLFAEGKNPYDTQEIEALRKREGIDFGASDLWNPPWTFFLVLPLQTLPLHRAASFWAGINILALLGVGLIALHLYSGGPMQFGRAAVVLFTAYLLCAPARQALWYGQLSIVLALFFSLAVWAFSRHFDFLGGVALFALTPKPHLFYLVFLTALVVSFSRRRFRVWSGFGLAALVCVATVYLFNSRALTVWLHGARRPLHLFSATLASELRSVTEYLGGGFPDWPLYAVPSLGVLAWLYFLATQQWRFDWRAQAVLVITVSLATAPYGWFFDFAPFLIGNVFLIARALESDARRKYSIFMGLLLLYLVSVLPAMLLHLTHDALFWYPWAFLGLWLWGMRTCENETAAV